MKDDAAVVILTKEESAFRCLVPRHDKAVAVKFVTVTNQEFIVIYIMINFATETVLLREGEDLGGGLKNCA
jgi:hypothetical protein